MAPVLRRLARVSVAPGPLRRRWERAAEAAARPFFALRDVDLEVRRSETLGIVGRNGSGKSTLLQIVAGTVAPTGGEVAVSGRVAALLELGAGFNPEFTGRENVAINAAILGLTPEQTRERFDEIASFADIGEFMDQPVKTFSSGMYVRLAFAVAVNVDADLLIVDEALAVGDEAFQRKCFARLEWFKRHGGTILFVSHSSSAVVGLCDRAVLLDRGELLLTDDPKTVLAAYHKLLYGATDPDSFRDGLRSGAEAGESPGGSAAADASGGGSYDPALVPQSTVSYDRRGAEIRDACVTTLSGRRVNVLDRGREYLYGYEVRFLEECQRVRFGMLIKTLSGFELSGAASSPPGEGIDKVAAGTTARVRFRFRCGLMTGTYFLNAGVVGDLSGEEGYLHRIVDVAMFKVSPETPSTSSGIVDLAVEPEIDLKPAGAPEEPARGEGRDSRWP